jgi:hypothetical protein
MPKNCYNCGASCPDEYCNDCQHSIYTHCEKCAEKIELDAAYSIGGKHYCEQCYKETFLFCAGCLREVEKIDTLESPNGDYYCPTCFSARFMSCPICNTIIHQYDSYNSPIGRICSNCFHARYGVCEGCSEIFQQSALRRTSQGWYCNSCEPSHPSEWDQSDYSHLNPSYTKIGSTRKYGIELETYSCNEWSRLNGNTVFGAKHDPSIEGMEFISPIFYGDHSFEDIQDLCDYAKLNKWKVNSSCGYHLHIDVSKENWQSLQKIALAYYLTYSAWTYFVTDNRVTNNFCGRNYYNSTEILNIASQSDWDYFAGKCDRFEFINWRAFFVHGSVEVRLHEGTLDYEAICNWVSIHTRFIDHILTLDLSEIGTLLGEGPLEQCFKSLSKMIGPELTLYYSKKMQGLGKHIDMQEIFSSNLTDSVS